MKKTSKKSSKKSSRKSSDEESEESEEERVKIIKCKFCACRVKKHKLLDHLTNSCEGEDISEARETSLSRKKPNFSSWFNPMPGTFKTLIPPTEIFYTKQRYVMFYINNTYLVSYYQFIVGMFVNGGASQKVEI